MNKTEKSKSGLLFVVSAPTGGGKSTLVTKALPILQKQFAISRIVTYTTREQRPGEIHGQDYHFVTKAEFFARQNADFFAETTQYHNHLYGSPKDFLPMLSEGKSFIAITDRAGVAFYKKLCPNAICIWITPPSLEVLAKRLTARGSESPDSLKHRLQLAEAEMISEQQIPLCSNYIVNDDIGSAVAALVEMISTAINKS